MVVVVIDRSGHQSFVLFGGVDCIAHPLPSPEQICVARTDLSSSLNRTQQPHHQPAPLVHCIGSVGSAAVVDAASQLVESHWQAGRQGGAGTQANAPGGLELHMHMRWVVVEVGAKGAIT